MSKVKVVKGLGNIEQLFNRNIKAPANRNKVNNLTKSTAVVISEDDSMSMTIWKVMQDGISRSQQEIIYRVEGVIQQQIWYEDFLIDRLNIQAVIFKLVTEGVLLRTGSVKNFQYQIIPGVPMPACPMQAKPAKTIVEQLDEIMKEAPKDYLDLNVLHVSHGIDACIWKACFDYKPRSIDDIADAVAVAGFLRTQVKDRVIVLAGKSNWFTRGGFGHKLRYTLKKSCRLPDAPMVKKPVVAAPVDKSKPVTMEHAIPVAVTKVAEPEKSQPIRTIGEVESRSHSAAVSAFPVVQEAIDFCGDAIITGKDTVMKAIIKAMLDGKQYTAGDIIVLLDDYIKETGRQKHTVYTTLNTAMARYDWITRVESPAGLAYRLKSSLDSFLDRRVDKTSDTSIDGIRVPFFKIPEEVKPPVTVKQDKFLPAEYILSADTFFPKPKSEPDSDGDKNSTSVTNTPIMLEKENDVSETPTMFEVIIRIKGKDYTVKQAERIAKAIEEIKVSESNTDDILEVRQQIVLSGNALTPEEAQVLLNEFKYFGFINK